MVENEGGPEVYEPATPWTSDSGTAFPAKPTIQRAEASCGSNSTEPALSPLEERKRSLSEGAVQIRAQTVGVSPAHSRAKLEGVVVLR